MTLETEVQSLRQVPMFRDIDPARLKLLAFTSERVNFAEGQKFFQKMFTEKIPGTETTYVSAVSRVQEKANLGLSAAMGTEMFGKFQSMSVKPENIETGFDPWTDYLQQKGK